MNECQTFLPPKEITALVLRLKENFDEKDFLFLVDQTKRIYFKRIESYFRTKNFLSEVEKDNLKDGYMSFIYDAVRTYDPDRKSGFTTYLHNSTSYMLYTLFTNEFKEERKQSEEWVDEYSRQTHKGEDIFEDIFSSDERSPLKKIIEECFEEYSEKNIKKILDLRFNSYQHRNASWREVSEKVGASQFHCQFSVNRFFKLVKQKLAKYNNVYN